MKNTNSNKFVQQNDYFVTNHSKKKFETMYSLESSTFPENGGKNGTKEKQFCAETAVKTMNIEKYQKK